MYSNPRNLLMTLSRRQNFLKIFAMSSKNGTKYVTKIWLFFSVPVAQQPITISQKKAYFWKAYEMNFLQQWFLFIIMRLQLNFLEEATIPNNTQFQVTLKCVPSPVLQTLFNFWIKTTAQYKYFEILNSRSRLICFHFHFD